MRRLLLFAFGFAYISSNAQQPITGSVVDTSENRTLENALISIIRASDSILIQFTRTNAEGSFKLETSASSPFIILITYPGYADYIETVKNVSAKPLSLGRIPLTRRSQLLEAVIVLRKQSAIRLKGDTLAFTADSFAVRQGATVDELLKQLPGIQVDRNGEITVQGQKVNKVLVDGDEFFSDDPAVVIKNLQAEAVQEVQVFDKKSDQAEFTGIEDGERSKTINLTLKADKKKGYFGKANVNGGTGGSFDNDVMMNAFQGTRKMAAFGIMSNTGRQGLNWQDMERFGGGYDVEFNEDEGYFMALDYNEEFNQETNNGEGLPAAWSAGLHFSDKWNGDRKKLNANYRFLKKNLNAEGTTISQYILPDTQYFNNRSRASFSTNTGHQLKGIYELKFDSLSSMKITISGSSSKNENASRQESLAINADSALVNSNRRLLNIITEKDNLNANILWRKKFKVKGRTLSVNLQQQVMNEDLDGLLQSQTLYYKTSDSIDRTEALDQKKRNSRDNYSVKTNIIYTEPLSQKLFLSFRYGFNFLQTTAFRNSFNKGTDEVYDKRDSLFSNDFKFRYNIQSGGTDIRYNGKKVTMVVGSGINVSNFRQTDLQRDSSRSYGYVNFFPKLMFKLSPCQYRSFTIRYDGRNNPPNLEQLQPIRENTDPLNVQLGNPALRQEFVHTASVQYNDYKIMSERGLYLFLWSNFMQNAISTATNVDEGGKTTYQPINVNGNYQSSFYGGYHWKLKKMGVNVGFGSEITLSRTSSVLNNMENKNDFQVYNIRFEARKMKKDKYSFSFMPRIGYTFSKSSLRADIVTKYLTSESQVDAWIKIPWKLELWSQANINIRQKTSVFDVNRNAVIWDATLVRRLLKNNNLELKFGVYDILNQNIGFNRSVNSNIITENSYITLRRRFMLGIQYSISKNP